MRSSSLYLPWQKLIFKRKRKVRSRWNPMKNRYVPSEKKKNSDIEFSSLEIMKKKLFLPRSDFEPLLMIYISIIYSRRLLQQCRTVYNKCITM